MSAAAVRFPDSVCDPFELQISWVAFDPAWFVLCGLAFAMQMSTPLHDSCLFRTIGASLIHYCTLTGVCSQLSRDCRGNVL